MRRLASALVVAALALAAAGCGGSNPVGQRALDAFFRHTARGRAWAKRYPHRPGGIPCNVRDPQLGQVVAATCSTDVSLVKPDLVVVTLTESWNHGSRAHTLFVFARRDGTLVSVIRERADGS